MGYYAQGDYYFGDPGLGAAMAGKMRGLGGRIKGGLKSFKKDPGLAAMKRIGKAGLKKVKDPFGLGVPGAKGGHRHRRMNVLNPRALRKALRRAEGFTRFARRIVKITMPKRRVSGFRFRRRRRKV